MSARRTVRFCGAITGRVTLRPGETPETALERAEATLLALTDRYAKRLAVNIGLEEEEDPS